LSDIVERACRASNRCFERGEVEETHALATAEEEVTVVEVAEHTVACYVAVTVATAEEDPATCAMEGTHVLGFEHQESFRPVPFPMEPCLEAYRYSVGGDAFGQVELVYAAGPSEKEPYCYVAEIAGDRLEAAFADLDVVAFEKPCHIDCRACLRMWK
jgi:hypothetical protein